jgi:Fe-S-cluster containining protein
MGINRDSNSTMKWTINQSTRAPKQKKVQAQPEAPQGEPQTLEQRLMRELGQAYFMGEPPLLITYDTAKWARRAKNEKLFKKLLKLYESLPAVTCGDCGHVCCSDSPDFYVLEYLHAWRHIRYELKNPDLEAGILHRALRWAFLKFVAEDVQCPFLSQGKCMIYDVRPLNCRAWALEDDAYYQAKAERARESVKKQQAYFEDNGVKLLKPLEEFILPRCREIQIHGHGAHLSEEQIREIDVEAAFLHKTLLTPEEFRSTNFHLHFPGHVALKKVDPADFDRTRLDIALEYQDNGSEKQLESILEQYGGQLP